MTTIVTRAGKGSALTHNEVDSNFTNLNSAKYESGNNATFGTINGTTITASTGFSGALNGTVGASTPAAGTFTSLTDSDLTSGRVTYASTGGLLVDSANLTFNGTTLTSTGFSGPLNAPNTFGFKNRVINGAMQIDQRNDGASLSLTGGAYSLDRWRIQAGNNLGTVQRITSTLSNFSNSLKYTSTGTNAFMQSGQQIEFSNCYDLQNNTVSISFRAKANNSNAGSTSLIVRTRTIAGVDGACLFAGTNSDTSVTLTTSDGYYTVTRTLPATFGSLSVEFVLGSHVSGDGFEITGVQLEKGSTATSFDYRPFGTELTLCQRYYYKTTMISGNNDALTGMCISTTLAYLFLNFNTTMRVRPTSLETTGTATDYSIRGSTGGGLICTVVPAYLNSTTNGAGITCTVASGIVAGNATVFRSNVTSSFFAWSAEL